MKLLQKCDSTFFLRHSVYVEWYIILVVSVCVCQMITFESLDVASSFAQPVHLQGTWVKKS